MVEDIMIVSEEDAERLSVVPRVSVVHRQYAHEMSEKVGDDASDMESREALGR